MGRFAKIGCLSAVGILVLVVILVVATGNKGATSTATSASSSPTATASDSAKTNTAAPDVRSTPVASTVSASNGSVAPSASKSSPSGAGDHGVVFGSPVSLSENDVSVLVTNSTSNVKSFTVKATYKLGDTIAATAVGAVNDLLPQSRRVANLLTTQAVPANATVSVQVDTMVADSKNSTGADVASKVKFGKPTVGADTTEVEVTNGDSKAHSFTVGMAFTKAGALVADGTGAVNDIAAGQTKTASLLVQGHPVGADQTSLYVDTVVQ